MDKDDTADLGDMEVNSDSVFQNSDVAGTESVSNLDEIGAKIDCPHGQKQLQPKAPAQAHKCFV